MKKEIGFAILIGTIVGLIIIYGVYLAQNSINSSKAKKDQLSPTPITTQDTTPQPQDSPNPTSPTPSTKSALTITSPVDELLSNKDQIEVSGTTTPLAVVVIISETTQTTVESDSTGKFTSTVELEGGYNTIRIVSIDKQGKKEETVKTVTYTTQNI